MVSSFISSNLMINILRKLLLLPSFALLFAMMSPADASCETKSKLAMEAASRLTDSIQTELTDAAQSMRDIDHFVNVTSKLVNEDCVGESSALSDLTSAMTSWSFFAYDANIGDDGTVRSWGGNSVIALIDALGTEPASVCRTYARGEAMRNIIQEWTTLHEFRSSESSELRAIVPLLWTKTSAYSKHISGYALPSLDASKSESGARLTQIAMRMKLKFGLNIFGDEPTPPTCDFLKTSSL